MILPPGDDFPLPDDDSGPVTIDSSSPTWDTTQQDLLSLVPGYFRTGVAIDRDAVLAMLGAVGNVTWSRAAFLLESQQSPRFAEGVFLDEWGDKLGPKRTVGESDEHYRARLLAGIKTITPEAIKAIVDLLTAQFTIKKTVYMEPAVDGAYLGPGTVSDDVSPNSNNDPTSTTYAGQSHGTLPVWAAFTQPVAGQSTANQTVYFNKTGRILDEYPDRLNAHPPAVVVPVTTGGLFWIFPPVDAGSDDLIANCQPVSDPIDTGQFNGDFQFLAPSTTSDAVVINSNNDPASSTYSTQSAHGVVPVWAYGYETISGLSLGEQIISEVEQRIAFGTAYEIIFDPFIGTAV